jgi:hypothetical protein
MRTRISGLVLALGHGSPRVVLGVSVDRVTAVIVETILIIFLDSVFDRRAILGVDVRSFLSWLAQAEVQLPHLARLGIAYPEVVPLPAEAVTHARSGDSAEVGLLAEVAAKLFGQSRFRGSHACVIHIFQALNVAFLGRGRER